MFKKMLWLLLAIMLLTIMLAACAVGTDSGVLVEPEATATVESMRIGGVSTQVSAAGDPVAREAETAVPSKSTEDMTVIEGATSQSGTDASALLWIQEEPSELAETQFDSLSAFIQSGSSAASYFTADVQEEIRQAVPAETDVAELILSEFVPLGIGEYDATLGDITALFQFPTSYQATQTAVAVVGYSDGANGAVWKPLETVIEDGKLRVVFPAELMAVIGHDTALAVLSY